MDCSLVSSPKEAPRKHISLTLVLVRYKANNANLNQQRTSLPQLHPGFDYTHVCVLSKMHAAKYASLNNGSFNFRELTNRLTITALTNTYTILYLHQLDVFQTVQFSFS